MHSLLTQLELSLICQTRTPKHRQVTVNTGSMVRLTRPLCRKERGIKSIERRGKKRRRKEKDGEERETREVKKGRQRKRGKGKTGGK